MPPRSPEDKSDSHEVTPFGPIRSAALSSDLFEQELALDERLDAMIDRAIKRLIQTKAMKQMLGQAGEDEHAKR
jgi:hypothetical protein